MDNPKQSFVFYFDNCAALDCLPPEQRGLAFSALCRYADRVWRRPDTDLEEVFQDFPQLSECARLACRLISGSILRDTRRWLHQREFRSSRLAQGAGLEKQPAASEQEKQFAENFARTKRLLERLRREEADQSSSRKPSR